MSDEHIGPCGKYCAVVDECDARGHEITRLRAALEGVTKPSSPWRDIESAPKDGTKIVVGIYFDGGKYPEEARWDFWVDSWRKYASGYGEGFGKPARPTVWMPLPEPPR